MRIILLLALGWLVIGYGQIGSAREKTGNISVPELFRRVPVEPGTFAEWLRNLPLRERGAAVHLYNGESKSDQSGQYRVIDLDIGKKNLQQCADAVIRLRAEYLYHTNQREQIRFNFTNGDTARYSDWREGYRPRINGNRVIWRKLAAPDSSYSGFRRYLETVFTYAGSYSLQKELQKVEDVNDIRIGDVFIQGGFPGHAVIVVDLAEKADGNRKLALLAQSYMPAQDIHLLRNPEQIRISPWFEIGKSDRLITPDWIFGWQDLYRFP